MTLQAIKYQNGKLEILDQLLLPNETKYIAVNDTNDGWTVINKMQVRGAPAIAVVGSLSFVAEVYNIDFETTEKLIQFAEEKFNYLVSSRPTAVNMKESRNRFVSMVQNLAKEGDSADTIKTKLIKAIEDMVEQDVSTNVKLSGFGADKIISETKEDQVVILTHCNTGALATAGHGTALGVVRSLKERGKLLNCYCTETRPYNQGSRLTAYEIVQDKIPGTLICDNMASMLMKTKKITAVIVGADRISANGDTANKIGTYQLAIVAQFHKVPFYVAAPSTSVDLNTETGEQIVIEERPANELKIVNGIYLAPKEIGCWNPAFDVTPAELITGGIITEFGVFRPSQLKTELTKHLQI